MGDETPIGGGSDFERGRIDVIILRPDERVTRFVDGPPRW